MASTKVSLARKRRPDIDLWLLARHDFSQPAQTLELLAKSLMSEQSVDDRRRTAAAVAHIASALREMVAGLTLVARLGPQGEPQHAVEVGEVIRPAIAEIGDHASVACGGTEVGILADRSLLAAAVRGALLYAVKFCDAGDVRVDARRSGKTARVEIKFRGKHPLAVNDEMAFVELAPSVGARRPLVGLAPALVARVLEAMGGKLQLDAGRDGLARIVLSLPAAPNART